MYKMFAKRCYMVSEPVHGCHLLDESKTFSNTDDPLSGPTFPSETIDDRLNCIVTGLKNDMTTIEHF